MNLLLIFLIISFTIIGGCVPSLRFMMGVICGVLVTVYCYWDDGIKESEGEEG